MTQTKPWGVELWDGLMGVVLCQEYYSQRFDTKPEAQTWCDKANAERTQDSCLWFPREVAKDGQFRLGPA